MPPAPPTTGVVVIGRNEGVRLSWCLESVVATGLPCVYVDSGSTDASVDVASALGVPVLALDPTRPFTAGRGRNEGLDHLVETVPGLALVQFVDGDCRLEPTWIPEAGRFLCDHPDVVAVCGRLRERSPDASVFSRLVDMEWDAPVGDVSSCGGVAMMRVAALRDEGGFDESLIACEEPDLCLRLRRRGHRVVRRASAMAVHDAGMTRFSQWWSRAVRWGFAYTQMVSRHRRGAERHWVRALVSTLTWACLLPLAAVILAPLTGGRSLWLLLLWLVPIARTWIGARAGGRGTADALVFGVACWVSKFAELTGVLRFLLRRRGGGRRAGLAGSDGR